LYAIALSMVHGVYLRSCLMICFRDGTPAMSGLYKIDAPSSAGVAPSRSRVNNSRPTP
jgi:hypothetical protein